MNNIELRSDKLENVYALFCGIDFKFDMKIFVPFCYKMKCYRSCTYQMVGAKVQW